MILDQMQGKDSCLQMSKDPSNSLYLLFQGSKKNPRDLGAARAATWNILNFSHRVNLPTAARNVGLIKGGR